MLSDEDYVSSFFISTIFVESLNSGEKSICPTKYRMKILNTSIRDVNGGSIFFDNIEKVHEFDRILVFTSETP